MKLLFSIMLINALAFVLASVTVLSFWTSSREDITALYFAMIIDKVSILDDYLVSQSFGNWVFEKAFAMFLLLSLTS